MDGLQTRHSPTTTRITWEEVGVASENGTVLITGGAGFIGANLANRLLTRGHDVTILDDFSRSGVERNVAWLRDAHGDAVKVIAGSIVDPASRTV